MEVTEIITYRVFGHVHTSLRHFDTIDVGLFRGKKIDAEPVTWKRTTDAHFSFEVPTGTYYLHALSGVLSETDFFQALEWGSYGGLYGFGAPLFVTHDIGPLEVSLSSMGRDLLHIPSHRQISVSDIQAEWVLQVEQLLAADPSQSITHLADQLSINRVHLAATFKRARGMTIKHYRSRVRFEAAKVLLVQTEMPLIAVADEIGYESVSQLNRVFQQLIGVSPGRFRDLAKEAKQNINLHSNGVIPDVAFAPTKLRRFNLLDRMVTTIRGTVRYEGIKRGRIIYIGAFRTPTPTSYPVGWTSLPKPGEYTLRCSSSSPVYVMACYCEKPMRYPGDMRTAFADGVYGQSHPAKYGEHTNASALHVRRGELIERVVVQLFDNDTAARHSSPWTNVFMPDGR